MNIYITFLDLEEKFIRWNIWRELKATTNKNYLCEIIPRDRITGINLKEGWIILGPFFSPEQEKWKRWLELTEGGWKRRVRFEGRNHCYGKWTEMESFLKGKWRKVYIKDERRDCGSCAHATSAASTRFNKGDGILRKLIRFSLRFLQEIWHIILFEIFRKIKNLIGKILSDLILISKLTWLEKNWDIKRRKNLLQFVRALFFPFETIQNIE